MNNDVAPETPDFGPEQDSDDYIPPEPDLTEADLDSEDDLEAVEVPDAEDDD